MGIATVLKTLKVFVDFIPEPVKAPVSALLEISITVCERVEQVTENVQAVAELAEQQAVISADVVNELRGVSQAQIDSGDWVRRLEKLTKVLEEVRNCIFKNSEHGKSAKALVQLWNSPKKKKEIDALKAELDKTRDQLKLQLGIATLVGVQRITEILRELTQSHDKTLTDRLKPVFSARYDALGSPAGCLPGTRLALRDDLRNLLTADDGQRIVWLSGLAGTGKSTVARSICSDLRDTCAIVSFFIKRGLVGRSDQKRTLQTLVYQLAQCIPEVLSAVLRAKDEVFGARIHDQVNDLVLAPLSTVPPGARPVVIIIDAADELDDTTPSESEDTTPSECDLIHCFLHAIVKAKLPNIHVLVTSRGRPSDFLEPTYGSEASHDPPGLLQGVVKDLSVHDKSYHPDNDIRAYFAAQFKRIAKEQHLRHWRPSPDQIDDLVKMSAQLFIFAATVIRWVEGPAVEFSLGQLLTRSSALAERSGKGTIFALYEYVIGHGLPEENIPQELLRSAMGKKPDEGTEVHALDVTLSILRTLRCLREPLTPNVFAQLWAGHLIAEPTHYQGAVAIAEHLISRLSGVLFIWEPHSSMTLLHASFGDFLDAPSSRYHVSSEATHADLASKCVSIMLTTKDAYAQFDSTSLLDSLLIHRLDTIPWIPDSDLATRYSFAQWIPHTCSAPHTQRARLLEQVRLAESGFWVAGVFLDPRYNNIESLQQVFDAMRDPAVAYTFATAVYMCADETSGFNTAWAMFSELKDTDSRSLPISPFQMMCDALSTLSNHGAAGTARSDGLKAMLDYEVDVLDQGLRDFASTLIRDLELCHNNEKIQASNSLTGNWPSNFSTRIHNLAAVLERFKQHMECWEKEMGTLISIAEELEELAKEFRYALRDLKYQIIVRPFDEQVIAALDRRNASLTRRPAHAGDRPNGVDSILSARPSLGVDAPPHPERKSLQADGVLPPELHSVGSLDPSPAEGQSLLVDEPPRPRDSRRGSLSQFYARNVAQ